MDLRDSPEDGTFRREARSWLEENLVGAFSEARGAGRAGNEHEGREIRVAWERKLGSDGWIGLGWPRLEPSRRPAFYNKKLSFPPKIQKTKG